MCLFLHCRAFGCDPADRSIRLQSLNPGQSISAGAINASKDRAGERSGKVWGSPLDPPDSRYDRRETRKRISETARIPMKESISFRLNGKPIHLDVDGDRTLLWVLRTDLGLTGTKFGCCLLYTSPSPRDRTRSRMPSSA